MTEPIYLDYNGTTPLAPEVVSVITETLTSAWGNPSSAHSIGLQAAEVISTARQQVSEMIGSTAPEIIFTSGGTEANNMVLYSVTSDHTKLHKKRKISNGTNGTNGTNGKNHNGCNNVETNETSVPHVVISKVEHDSVSKCARHLRETGQICLTEVALKDGMLLVEDVLSACNNRTRLVSIMLANNETGVIFPIADISAAVKAVYPAILVHTDAAQAIGKLYEKDLNVKELKVDFLTIVGHKFYGPRIGALYIRQGAPYTPLLYGGGQERDVRPGTQNTPMIAGLGAACALVTKHCNYTKLTSVRDYLESRLKEEFAAVHEVLPMRLDKHLISKQSLWNMIQFLPLCLIVLVTISGVGVYSWAWATGNIIGETVPMISHMGTYPPQSCFFTLILSFASFGLFMIVVIMHQIILGRYKLQSENREKIYKETPHMMLNDVSLLFGVLSSLGLSLVGDFQTTEMSSWHKAGLAVFVLFGQAYMYCMLFIAPRGGRPNDDGDWVPDKHYWDFFRISRLIVSIATSLFIIMFGVFYGLAYNNWIPSSDDASRSKWSPSDGGFYYYRTAACFEITFVISFLLFVATLQRGREVVINCSQHPRLPNTCNFAIMTSKKGCSSQNILARVKSFTASKGAACHSGDTASPSRILINSGVPDNIAGRSIRLSIGKDTSTEDIDVVMNELLCIVKYNCNN